MEDYESVASFSEKHNSRLPKISHKNYKKVFQGADLMLES